MELPSVSSLEFEQIKSSIKNYIRTKTEFKDYDFEGSNLSMLVDILAYNSMYSAYNVNMAANELNLDTAVIRDNIVSHAKRLGYTPNSYTSSRVTIDINANNITDNTITYLNLESGPVLTATTSDGIAVTFLCKEAIKSFKTDSTTISFDNIELVEGLELSIEYYVDSSNENQRFIIPNNFVDSDSIKVFVDSNITGQQGLEIEYSRRKSIVGVSSSDRIFFVEEIQDQQYEIIFGDNVIGRKLENGEKIIVKYIISSGSIANDIKNFEFIGTIKSNNDIIIGSGSITFNVVSEKSGGGSEFEDIKSIKYRAPRYYAAQQRAVTTSDYESIIQNIYSNIDIIKVTGGEELEPPQYGKVLISIKPKIGEKISFVEKNRIVSDIKNYIVGSVTPIIYDAIPFYIVISPTIVYDSSKTSKSLSAFNSDIQTKIDEFNKNSEFKAFGGLYSSSKLTSSLESIDSSIKFITLSTIFNSPLTLYSGVSYSYESNFYGILNNKTNSNYTLISDPFCVKGLNVPVRLVSYSYGYGSCNEDSTQSIYLSTLQGRVLREVGTIDYKNGKIKFSLISCEDTEINIYVTPLTPDIVTGPNVYPVLIKGNVDIIDYANLDANVVTNVPLITSDLTTTGDTLNCSGCVPQELLPVINIPGTTVTNPDGSITETGSDGTSTTTLPDGTTIIELPTDISTPDQGTITNPTIDNFTPEPKDTCS
jgi:hypothetical protein